MKEDAMTQTNWYEATRDLDSWILSDWLNGNIEDDEDSMYEYAHETADSCEYSTYYYQQRALWDSSALVRDYQGDAIDAGCDHVESIQAYCVYQAISDYLVETIPQVIEDNHVLSVVTKDSSFISSTGVRVIIPVLAITRTPKVS